MVYGENIEITMTTPHRMTTCGRLTIYKATTMVTTIRFPAKPFTKWKCPRSRWSKPRHWRLKDESSLKSQPSLPTKKKTCDERSKNTNPSGHIKKWTTVFEIGLATFSFLHWRDQRDGYSLKLRLDIEHDILLLYFWTLIFIDKANPYIIPKDFHPSEIQHNC